MHRVDIARYLAARIDGSSNGMAQNIVDTLRGLAEQVESLERSLTLMNADCMRLANERDEARQELADYDEKRNDRRENARPHKTH